MPNHPSNNRCPILHRQIYTIHLTIVNFYESVESKPIGIPLEHQFRYALQSYLDATQRTLSIVNDGKEEALLVQTQEQLLMVYYDMIDFVEGRFRTNFHAMIDQYTTEAVGRHVNIQQFHNNLSDIEKIITDSKKNRDNCHQLYSLMENTGDTAQKMVKNFALLKNAESLIAKDAAKSRFRFSFYLFIPAAVGALITAIITVILD